MGRQTYVTVPAAFDESSEAKAADESADDANVSTEILLARAGASSDTGMDDIAHREPLIAEEEGEEERTGGGGERRCGLLLRDEDEDEERRGDERRTGGDDQEGGTREGRVVEIGRQGVARDWKMRADRRVLTFCAIPKLEFGASFESFV